jgi:hypothetical protein
MFSRADDAKRTAEEAKATTEAWVQELSLAGDDAIVALAETVTVLSEQSAELQEFRLVVGKVCAQLSPSPLIEVPLVDWLRSLPGHVERVIAEGVFHGSDLALG